MDRSLTASYLGVVFEDSEDVSINVEVDYQILIIIQG